MTAGPEAFEVLAVRYGTRHTTRSDVFLHHHLYGEPDGPIDMDYYFWVARSRGRTVVVDCGFNERSGRRRGRTMLSDPARALRQIGVDPGDVSHLVVTHAHYDHIGNLGLFPRARVVVASSELAFWTGPWGQKTLFAHSVEDEDVATLQELAAAGRVDQVTGRSTLVDGIELIEVGGHTPGQLIVLVRAAEAEVILASDSLHYYEELELDRPFTHVADLPAMYAGFALLRELVAEPGRVLVAGHDPLVMEQFAPVPGSETLAVRVA